MGYSREDLIGIIENVANCLSDNAEKIAGEGIYKTEKIYIKIEISPYSVPEIQCTKVSIVPCRKEGNV